MKKIFLFGILAFGFAASAQQSAILPGNTFTMPVLPSGISVPAHSAFKSVVKLNASLQYYAIHD